MSRPIERASCTHAVETSQSQELGLSINDIEGSGTENAAILQRFFSLHAQILLLRVCSPHGYEGKGRLDALTAFCGFSREKR